VFSIFTAINLQSISFLQWEQYMSKPYAYPKPKTLCLLFIMNKVGPAAVAGGGMLIWSMMLEAKMARHLSASIT
jgi:hypothetical protein